MTVYTYFLRQAGGMAASFEAFEAADDAVARALAGAICAQHPSAAYVDVYDGDRLILRLERAATHPPGPPGVAAVPAVGGSSQDSSP
ncbi:MAG: hypothetical protein JWQ52_1468 [Phenylobacterium sp.]|nr:hypothetical protein [Phenylobacterium sp.]